MRKECRLNASLIHTLETDQHISSHAYSYITVHACVYVRLQKRHQFHLNELASTNMT